MRYFRRFPKAAARILASLLLVAAVAGAASAQSIDQITKKGEVTIGVVTGVPPFGSINPNGDTVGYDVDVANLLAKDLGVKVKIVPLTPPARIPALISGKVDILVATLAPTPERAKSVMFTMPYSAFQQVILAPTSAQESSLKDMVGKNIGVPRGSPQDVELTRIAPKGTKIVRFQDDATAAQALFSGQVDAIAIPNITANDILKKRNQGDNYQIKFAFSTQPNSIAVRSDAFQLHQWINDFLYNVKLNGKLNAISEKWIGTPLPDLPVF